MTYTIGSQYFVWLPTRYPASYYDVSTALRAGLALGNEVVRVLPRGRELGVYCELVALDALLYSWFLNPRELGPEDVFTLAIGLRVRI